MNRKTPERLIKQNAKRLKKRGGNVLGAIVVMIFLTAVLGLGITVITSTESYNEIRLNNFHRAKYLADAGMRYARYAYNNPDLGILDPSGTYTLDNPEDRIVINMSSVGGYEQVLVTGIAAAGTNYESRVNRVYPETGGAGPGLPAWNPNDPSDPNTDFYDFDFSDTSNWNLYDSDKMTTTSSVYTKWSDTGTFLNFDCQDVATDSEILYVSCGDKNEMTTWDTLSGYYPWTTTSTDYFSSPSSIGADFSTSTGSPYLAVMTYTATTIAGTVSFYYNMKGDDESVVGGGDGNFLYFWIDDPFSGTWMESGTSGGWLKFETTVTEGAHEFGWAYKRDTSIATDDGAWIDDVVVPDKPESHDYTFEQVVLDGTDAKPIDWNTAWSHANHLLSYDVQTKVAWGANVDDAMSGISFRWQPHPDFTTATKSYQGYGFSIMYHAGTCQDDNIPDGLKPPGTCDESAETNPQPLLMLWKQTVTNNAGSPQTTREWIAYKKLPEYDTNSVYDYANGQQYIGDGEHINDLMSLFVRVTEARDAFGNKYNDIRAFYGDASTYNSYPGNTEPFDSTRKVYPPLGNAASPGVKWPVAFTPLNLGTQWTQDYDYMTLIKWDAVNPSSSGTVLTDGYTLRDSTFTTPDVGSLSYGEDANQGDEVGIHAIGELDYCGSGTYNVVNFNDFRMAVYSPN